MNPEYRKNSSIPNSITCLLRKFQDYISNKHLNKIVHSIVKQGPKVLKLDTVKNH